jgi:hypothetical protein
MFSGNDSNSRYICDCPGRKNKAMAENNTAMANLL